VTWFTLLVWSMAGACLGFCVFVAIPTWRVGLVVLILAVPELGQELGVWHIMPTCKEMPSVVGCVDILGPRFSLSSLRRNFIDNVNANRK